jgi:hypothetical protein
MFEVHIYVDGRLVTKSHVDDTIDDGVIEYMAAAPATTGYSRVGSGLPFLDMNQAFDNSPNKGHHLLMDGFFTVHIKRPNSFYSGMGRTLVPPSLFIRYKRHGEYIERRLPLCTAATATQTHTNLHNWPKSRKSPMFYATSLDLPVRCQEAILREGAGYLHRTRSQNQKKVSAVDFWGLRPPV